MSEEDRPDDSGILPVSEEHQDADQPRREKSAEFEDALMA